MFGKKRGYFVLLLILFVGSFLSGYVFFAFFEHERAEKIVLVENSKEVSYQYDEQEKRLLQVFYAFDVSEKTQNTIEIKIADGIKVFVRKEDSNKYELLQHSKEFYTEPKKIAILYISTGKYIKFWDGFYQAMEKYFLPRHEKTYFLFTDHDDLAVPKNVVKVHQDQLPWPYITFKRFHFFDGVKDKLKEFDYIYFLNGTMMPVAEINEEIFPTKEQEIMVTLHPGYFRGDQKYLPYDRNPRSKAYIAHGDGKYYFMGGFNGGTSEGFLKLIERLMNWTDIDLLNKVMPAWHDESMLNRYVLSKMGENLKPLILTPLYAVPQTGHSGVDEFRVNPRQLILDKAKYGGHGYLRNSD